MIIRKPPMGWNSWNTFGPAVCEKVILETADAIVEKGLDKAGYEYVVVDDCWSLPKRGEDGLIKADPEKFPHGMKYVADYVHSKGLKFGIYSCIGAYTCAGYPGSFDHEFTDAQMFADWGVDFLKYDYCNKTKYIPGEILYNRMSLALKATGRDILFAVCNFGKDGSPEWIRSVGAHMYRVHYDIFDSFDNVRDIMFSQKGKYDKNATGCYADLDMLICGMYGKGNIGIVGCTPEEYATHFATWCYFGSPLMLGCDVRTMDDATLKLVTDPKLLALDQDEDYRHPMVVHDVGDHAYTLFRHLSDGTFAVGFFNFNDDATFLRFETFEVGLTVNSGYVFEFDDIINGKHIDNVHEYENFMVDPHSVRIFKARLVKSPNPSLG